MKKDDKLLIGEKLIKLRDKKGVTQKVIAEKFGIAISTYSQYESNINKPNYSDLKKISEYFEVPINYFFEKNYNNELASINSLLGNLAVIILKAEGILSKLDSIKESGDKYNEYSKYKDRLGQTFSEYLNTNELLDNFIDLYGIEDRIIENMK